MIIKSMFAFVVGCLSLVVAALIGFVMMISKEDKPPKEK